MAARFVTGDLFATLGLPAISRGCNCAGAVGTAQPSEAKLRVQEIYADFHDVAADRTLPLTCAGSRASIAELSEAPKEGEEVMLSDGELVTIATVHARSPMTPLPAVLLHPAFIPLHFA